MPLLRIDQALVQHFQHIGLDVGQPEPGGLRRHLPHQGRSRRSLERPIEEVRLDRAQDALVGQPAAGEQARRVVHRQIQHAGGDRLDHDRQVGVLQEQRILADILAVRLAQQPVP